MAESERNTEQAATRFGKAGNHWAAWGSNLIVTGVIIVTALAIGRQVSHWWRAPDEPELSIPSDAAAPFGQDQVLHQISTSSSTSRVERMSIVGDKEAAFAQMRRTSLRLAAKSNQPLSTTPGQSQLLERLGSQNPVQTEGDIDLHQTDGPLLYVAAVKSFAGSPEIACWAIGMPDATGDAQKYTLFFLHAGDRDAESEPELNYPVSMESSLQIAVSEQSSLRAFSSNESMGSCREYFDGALLESSFEQSLPWSDLGNTSFARYSHKDGRRIEVHLTLASDGTVRGLLASSQPVAVTKPTE